MAAPRSEDQHGDHAVSCDAASGDRLERVNSFSLVSYIPGELGDFLTELRQELVCDCIAQSHVTILPPRPIQVDTSVAEQDLRERLADYEPFEIYMPGLRVFEASSVIYADVALGRDRLIEMHRSLNAGPLAYNEPWEYHPHVTLAQGLSPEQLPEVLNLAQRRWKESAPTRSFLVETLAFVQNTTVNRWIDLAEYDLRGALSLSAR